ncbi:MAG: hypothetical protein LUG93_02035 [Lachnospiraceae bacterium]|nr:hypothetical protein [Lachnospiraceae bacterium]
MMAESGTMQFLLVMPYSRIAGSYKDDVLRKFSGRHISGILAGREKFCRKGEGVSA